MTQDFNYKLMKYLTGEIVKGKPNDTEIIQENIESDYWNGFIPANKDFRFEGLIEDKKSDNILLYGGYIDENNETFGIIVILDNKFNPIKSYTKFENGTKLRYIDCLNQADDGTFYFIDDTIFSYSSDSTSFINGERRFVQVNNIVTNNSIKLRKTYIFPKDKNNFKCKKIEKNPNSSQYILVGNIMSSEGNSFFSMGFIELKINVGESNEWNETKFEINISIPKAYIYSDSLISFNDDKYKIIILYNSYFTPNYIALLSKDYNSNSVTEKIIYRINDRTQLLSNFLEYQSIFINENLLYFVLTNQYRDVQYDDVKIKLIEYNNSNDEINEVFSKSYGEGKFMLKSVILLNKNQGQLYINYIEISDTSNYLGKYYIQRYNGKWNPIVVKENAPLVYYERGLYINNNYNLLNIFMFPIRPRKNLWYFNISKEIYNPTNYNGIPYENTNSLVPNSGILYNENNNIIFARNLYNKTINNRITQSTIEVPNTYLNNTIIKSQELDSKTNNVMVNNINTITKNIYETLFINFINTLQITNKNDENNIILNPTGATRLNISISDLIDYDNAKATKIRINYDDGTNLIRDVSNNIEDVRQVNLLTFTNYDFVVYNPANKNIKTIDIISNDETTIYQTISNLNFESNKYYNIMQPVQILGNV